MKLLTSLNYNTLFTLSNILGKVFDDMELCSYGGSSKVKAYPLHLEYNINEIVLWKMPIRIITVSDIFNEMSGVYIMQNHRGRNGRWRKKLTNEDLR